MIQNVVVFLIVACAACAVAARYMPSTLRHLMWQRISGAMRRCGWLQIAAYADTKREAAPACGSGCKQCNGCHTAPVPATAIVQFFPRPDA